MLNWQYRYEINRCILCHEAPCQKACDKGVNPADRIRSLYFNDDYKALDGLDCNKCKDCDALCEKSCLLEKPIVIKQILKDVSETKDEAAMGMAEPDLSCDICGVKLINPFLLSSSVVGSNYEMVSKAFDLGWAGVAYKTICTFEQHEASPRFSVLKDHTGSFFGFKNIEQLSSHTVPEELAVFKRLKQDYPDRVIIASIMGVNEEEWEELSRLCDEAGADVIELNFSCPNLEDTTLGKTIGQSEEQCEKFTAAARRGTKKPILAKLTPNVEDMVPFARACKRGGADGIAAINTIMSITGVNLNTLTPEPGIKGKSSAGGYSGKAVKPIALRFISDIKRDEFCSDMHISGMGGIEEWSDAVEFLLLGSGSVQVTTAVMQYGYRIIEDLLFGLKTYMRRRDITSVYQLINASIEHITELDNLERDTVLFPSFNPSTCIGCGRCYISCFDGGHQAISFDLETRKPKLNGHKCVGCHLCRLVCPCGSISMSKLRINKLSGRII